MHTGKITKIIMLFVLLLAMITPTAVFAGFDGKGSDAAAGNVLMQHDDEAEEVSLQEGATGGAGAILGLLAGVIFLIIAVVAILGAVGLGIIGIGYASVSPSED